MPWTQADIDVLKRAIATGARRAEHGSGETRRVVEYRSLAEMRQIGVDIKAVQFGWPLGLPLVDHLGGDIWEVRVRLESRIARILFATEDSSMVLLHGFIKKDRKTPKADLDLARDRLKRMRGTK